MTRLDLSGLRDLWYRIDDIFARLTEAGGSLSWDNAKNLTLVSCAGGTLNTVNLDNGLATDTEAAGDLTTSGTYGIKLKNINGSAIGTAIDLSNLLKGYFGRGLAKSNNKIYLVNGNGSQLGNQIDLPSTSGLASKTEAAYDISVWVDGGDIWVRLYDVDGNVLNSSHYPLPTS